MWIPREKAPLCIWNKKWNRTLDILFGTGDDEVTIHEWPFSLHDKQWNTSDSLKSEAWLRSSGSCSTISMMIPQWGHLSIEDEDSTTLKESNKKVVDTFPNSRSTICCIALREWCSWMRRRKNYQSHLMRKQWFAILDRTNDLLKRFDCHLTWISSLKAFQAKVMTTSLSSVYKSTNVKAENVIRFSFQLADLTHAELMIVIPKESPH